MAGISSVNYARIFGMIARRDSVTFVTK